MSGLGPLIGVPHSTDPLPVRKRPSSRWSRAALLSVALGISILSAFGAYMALSPASAGTSRRVGWRSRGSSSPSSTSSCLGESGPAARLSVFDSTLDVNSSGTESVERELDFPERAVKHVDEWDVDAVEACQCLGSDTLALDVLQPTARDDAAPPVGLAGRHERDGTVVDFPFDPSAPVASRK